VGVDYLWTLAFQRGEYVPDWVGGVEAREIMIHRASIHAIEDSRPVVPEPPNPLQARISTIDRYVAGDLRGALAWCGEPSPDPHDLTELAVIADVRAEAGDPRALPAIEALRRERPAEADLIRARYHLQRQEGPAAAAAFESAIREYDRDPWTWTTIVGRCLPLAGRIAAAHPAAAPRLFAALAQPIPADCADLLRRGARFEIARQIEGERFGPLTRTAVEDFGVNGPWTLPMLSVRVASCAANGDPRLADARRDLMEFQRDDSAALPNAVPAVGAGAPGVAGRP
jgi:hypothetical protein